MKDFWHSIIVAGLCAAFSSNACYALEGVASTVGIYKSPNDERQYEGMYLTNGLKVLLVSDKNAEIAAASLNVAVGSFNEPDERAGLAHFLEHMLFLGTGKYPQPDEFSAFIRTHGGEQNAWTGNRNTQYFFSVVPDYLSQALDRFAQFFIDPLFAIEFVERERNAVNSEYMLNLYNDDRRQAHVFKTIVNPNHPFHRFSVGNVDTLADSNDSRVRDELIKFYQEHYSADQMVLVVVGPQSIDQLRSWVLEYFSAIPRRVVNNAETTDLILTKRELGQKLQIKNLSNKQGILLLYSVPNQYGKYKYASEEYVSNLLYRHGKGSLFAALKDQQWLLDIDVGVQPMSVNQDFFYISLDLTDVGMRNIDTVVQYVSSYLDYLRSYGANEDLFKQMQDIGQLEFTYSVRGNAYDLAYHLPMLVQNYPMSDVLLVNHVTNKNEFDKVALLDFLSYLRPDNMLLSVTSPNVNGKLKTDYYQVEYSVERFTEQQYKLWRTPVKGINFAIHNDLRYMPENTKLVSNFNWFSSGVPEQVINEPGLQVWHRTDTSFKVPKQMIEMLLATPNPTDTPKRAVLQRLLLFKMVDNLKAYDDQLEAAGVGVGFDVNQQGLIAAAYMFSDKQRLVLDLILQIVKNTNIKESNFLVHKEQLKTSLQSIAEENLYTQGRLDLHGVLRNPFYLPKELLSVIDSVTVQDCVAYHQEILRNVQLKALSYGNVTEKDSKAQMMYVAQQLPITKEPLDLPILPKIARIPAGESFVFNQVPTRGDGATALVSYYQSDATTTQEIAANMLLGRMLESGFFHQIRTVEQLGYVVGLMPSLNVKQPSIVTVVESPDRKADYILERQEAFFSQARLALAQTSEDEFNHYKDAVYDNLLEKPITVGAQTEHYWQFIIDGIDDFDCYHKIAKEVKKLSLSDVLMYYDRTLLQKNSMRSVFINVSAHSLTGYGTVIDNLEQFKSQHTN